jgi:hypothetical protein
MLSRVLTGDRRKVIDIKVLDQQPDGLVNVFGWQGDQQIVYRDGLVFDLCQG